LYLPQFVALDQIYPLFTEVRRNLEFSALRE
jgi:hypothetical protein